jgi:hypothetical protein
MTTWNPFPETKPPRRGVFLVQIVAKITKREYIRTDQWDGRKWTNTLDYLIVGWRENR